VKRTDPGCGKFHCFDLIGRQAASCLFRKRLHLDCAWGFSVYPHSDVHQASPPIPAHFVDDVANCRLQDIVAALLGPGECCSARGGAELVPDQSLHSIIFSIGTTRIADAPAAFSF
jgi:hypothetical protein